MTYINITSEPIATADPAKQIQLVKFQGQLDESNVDDNSKKIYSIIDSASGSLFLILDFGDLEYMNSKAIGYLTDWYGKITAKGGNIVIAKAKENILDILQVVGLTQLIQTHPTLDEAKLAVVGSS